MWSTGDGAGSSGKIVTYTAGSSDNCIKKVQDEEPTANGVTWNHDGGQCYAQFEMIGPTNGIRPSTGYMSCFLDSIITSVPVCDHTDGSAKHTSSDECFCGARIIGERSSGICSKNDYCYSPKSICTTTPDPDWVADCSFKSEEDKNIEACTCGVVVCVPAVNGPYCMQADSRWYVTG